MAPQREPTSLYLFAKCVLSRYIASRVRVLLHNGIPIQSTLSYFEKVIASLPTTESTDLAQTALRCADFLCERHSFLPSVLRLLASTLIHESTTAFEITKFHSYQLRQAVLHRLCQLEHLQVYYNLEHFHENQNIILVLERFQSLVNLREIYLPQWCNDDIALLLGKSCPKLQLLDARNSVYLTDAAVASLTQCTGLKIVLVHSTSLTDNGYQELLEKLPLLQKIGVCHSLNAIIANIKESRHSNHVPLSLREYQSSAIPDETVIFMCPNLSNVHLHQCKLPVKKCCKLPKHVTHLKIQQLTDNGNCLSALLTCAIIHLDLSECVVTVENISTLATTCENLRVFRLISESLDSQLRLSKSFPQLEEVTVTDSMLAFDIVAMCPKIRQVLIEPRKWIWPLSFPHPFWTDAALHNILDKNPLAFLESFYLSIRCKFSVNTITNFVHVCPRLRYLGHIHAWGRSWETDIFKLYPVLQKHNLAVELVL